MQRRAVLFLASLCAAIALVEAALRLFDLAPPVPALYGGNVRDDHIVFRREPLSVRRQQSPSGEFEFEYAHNSLGFRDTEHAKKKPPGTFRIVALGDSFTYGVGASFEDTYLRRVEQQLEARPGEHPRVEIVKLGLPRHFPLLERRTLEHYGLQFEPDLVLVAVLPNDVVDTHLGLDGLCASSSGWLVSCAAERWGSAGVWLYTHSALARVALRGWSLWQASDAPDGEQLEEAWRSLEAELSTMRDLAHEHGAKLAVVSIPQKPPWSEAPDPLHVRLGRWSEREGVALVPTLPALRGAEARSKPLYWERDGHCTAAGHEVIADAVVSGLASNGLVP